MEQLKVKIDDINLEAVPEDKSKQISLNLSGLRNPVKLRKNKNGSFDIIDGRRRIDSLAYLEIKEIDAFVYELDEISDEQMNVDGLISNSGKPNFANEATLISKLIGQFGYTIKNIADLTGFTIQTIYNRLALIEKLTPKYFTALERGDIVLNTAKELIKIDKPTQEVLFDNNLLGVREIKEAVKEIKVKKLPSLPILPSTLGAGYFIEYENLQKLKDGQEIEIKIGAEVLKIKLVIK